MKDSFSIVVTPWQPSELIARMSEMEEGNARQPPDISLNLFPFSFLFQIYRCRPLCSIYLFLRYMPDFWRTLYDEVSSYNFAVPVLRPFHSAHIYRRFDVTTIMNRKNSQKGAVLMEVGMLRFVLQFVKKECCLHRSG